MSKNQQSSRSVLFLGGPEHGKRHNVSVFQINVRRHHYIKIPISTSDGSDYVVYVRASFEHIELPERTAYVFFHSSIPSTDHEKLLGEYLLRQFILSATSEE